MYECIRLEKKTVLQGRFMIHWKFFCLCMITTRIKVLLAYIGVLWTTSIVFCLYFCDGNYYYTSWLEQSLNEIILLDSINLQLSGLTLHSLYLLETMTLPEIQLNSILIYQKKKNEKKNCRIELGGWVVDV